MIELNGKYGMAKVFTDLVDEASITQVIQLLNQEFIEGSQVRMMPDIHAGAGCTIGTTITIKDKICPNLVGVDIGCTDKDTEVLTPQGWIKISEYEQQLILVYDRFADSCHYEMPYAYIKQPCSKFYHFSSNKGLDQMLSAEHKMLIWRGYAGKGYVQDVEDAIKVFCDHNNTTKSNRTIKCAFQLCNADLPLSDDMIRVLVMISADARLRYNKNGTTHIELHFKKQRKIDRAKFLLNAVGLKYNEYQSKDGSTYISTTTKMTISKSLKQFFNASQRQLNIMRDEIYHWDGTIDVERNHKAFSSTDKINADVVQFAHAANGIRAGLYINPPNDNFNESYLVFETNNAYVGFPDKKFAEVNSVDGYKYCFTTSTGYFVIRRNNNISITGNCGMHLVQIKEQEIDFNRLDEVIRKYVPSGFSIRSKPHEYTNKIKIEDLVCKQHVDLDRAYKSVGTLGGGNHFIEVSQDSDGNYFLVVHSGSRHAGLQVAKYYQNLAYNTLNGSDYLSQINLIERLKQEGKQKQIEAELTKLKNTKRTHIPKDLAYLEGQNMADYLCDMKILQEYAHWNRKAIIETIMVGMRWTKVDEFETIHNYIDLDRMILRKGAVAAEQNQRLIIPMNMRDGCLICAGKGNPDWNYSAPHGAGRVLSRAQAKAQFNVEEYAQSMSGIYSTCVGQETLDECPMAYKPMQSIIDNIRDTVEVIKIIKPVYNFKASGD